MTAAVDAAAATMPASLSPVSFILSLPCGKNLSKRSAQATYNNKRCEWTGKPGNNSGNRYCKRRGCAGGYKSKSK